jgi:hypothetical protein
MLLRARAEQALRLLQHVHLGLPPQRRAHRQFDERQEEREVALRVCAHWVGTSAYTTLPPLHISTVPRTAAGTYIWRQHCQKAVARKR